MGVRSFHELVRPVQGAGLRWAALIVANGKQRINHAPSVTDILMLLAHLISLVCLLFCCRRCRCCCCFFGSVRAGQAEGSSGCAAAAAAEVEAKAD